MSKIYEKYEELKKVDSEKIYLFEIGAFYLFLDKDAENVSEKLNLKLTRFTKDILKCGFPSNSINKYKRLFREKELDVEIVKKEDRNKNDIINKIRMLDVSDITPIDALNILDNFKSMLD